jgi:hypothetical protein
LIDMRISRTMTSVVAVLAALAVACGSDAPTDPGASVSPTPAPTPTPSPTAPPTPSVKTCSLPPRPNCAAPEGPPGVYGCCRARSEEYGRQVSDSIFWLMENRKDLLDGNRVLNRTGFMQALEERLLQVYDLCADAENPLEDEIAVKGSNDFSEQYDVLLGDFTFVNPYGYQVTCRPARF